MAEPQKTIKYNGKDYDFYGLKEQVYKNYDNYARLFGYSRSKYDKDRQALAEILVQLEAGNGTVEPDKILFSNQWGNDKGSFGKARNKSRHYKNPTWMIIDTLQNMDKYNPDSGKKKLNENVIKQELSNALSGISGLSDKNKAIIQNETIDKIISKYSNGVPEGYVLDTNFSLDDYLIKLGKLKEALGTTDNLEDDELAYYRLGITNPNKPKEEEKSPDGVKEFIAAARKAGIPEVAASDDYLSTLWYKLVLPQRTNQFLQLWGVDTSTKQSSSGGGSRRSSGGVSSGSTTRRSSGSSGGSTTRKSSGGGGSTTKSSSLTLDITLRAYNAGVNVGDYILDKDTNRTYYVKSKGSKGEVHLETVDGNSRLVRNKRVLKEGSKLTYIHKLKKYKTGDKVDDDPPSGTIDGNSSSSSGGLKSSKTPPSGEITEGANNDTFFNKLGNLGRVALGIAPFLSMLPGPWGKIGRVATVAGPATYTTTDLFSGQPIDEIGQDVANLVGSIAFNKMASRRNPEAVRKYNEANSAHSQSFNPKKAELNAKNIKTNNLEIEVINAKIKRRNDLKAKENPTDAEKTELVNLNNENLDNQLKTLLNKADKLGTYATKEEESLNNLRGMYSDLMSANASPGLSMGYNFGSSTINSIYDYYLQGLNLPDNTSFGLNDTTADFIRNFGPATASLYRWANDKFFKADDLVAPGAATAIPQATAKAAAATTDAAATTNTAAKTAKWYNPWSWFRRKGKTEAAPIVIGGIGGGLASLAPSNTSALEFMVPYAPGYNPYDEDAKYNLMAAINGLPLRKVLPKGYEIGSTHAMYENPFTLEGYKGVGSVVGYDRGGMPVVEYPDKTRATIGAYQFDEGPVSYGNLKPWLKELGAYSDDDGYITIPAENAGYAAANYRNEMLNTPMVRFGVDPTRGVAPIMGPEGLIYPRRPGDIKPAETGILYNNPASRYFRKGYALLTNPEEAGVIGGEYTLPAIGLAAGALYGAGATGLTTGLTTLGRPIINNAIKPAGKFIWKGLSHPITWLTGALDYIASDEAGNHDE